MSKEKYDLWVTSVEVWKTGGAVTHFMRDQIAALRDADGRLLPEIVREFLNDLVFCKIKPPKKGRAIAITAIREAYKTRLFWEQRGAEMRAFRGTTLYNADSPKTRAIASIARDFKLSPRKISEVVHPRKARKR